MKKVTVICATLMRPEFQRLVQSLMSQTLSRDQYEFIPWGPSGEKNEYEARNWAVAQSSGEVLCFVDDDCVLPPDYLEKGLRHFNKYFDLEPRVWVLDPEYAKKPPIQVMNASIKVQGNLLPTKPFWTIGATLWCRREAFDKLGGFEVAWGLEGRVRGWRGDTDFVWRALDEFGDAVYLHAEDIVVDHPEGMKAHFDPRVEKLFYFRHKRRCLEILLPVDIRMAFYIPAIDPDPVAQDRAAQQVESLIQKGYVKRDQVEKTYEEYAKMMV